MHLRRITGVLTVIAAIVFSFAHQLKANDKEHNWEHAKVISQELTSSPAGAYAAPVGTATVAIPLYRKSNVVVVETASYRYQWMEQRTNKPVIFPVNDTIDFYRDGDWFVVLDAKHKKHKFSLVGMTSLQPQK